MWSLYSVSFISPFSMVIRVKFSMPTGYPCFTTLSGHHGLVSLHSSWREMSMRRDPCRIQFSMQLVPSVSTSTSRCSGNGSFLVFSMDGYAISSQFLSFQTLKDLTGKSLSIGLYLAFLLHFVYMLWLINCSLNQITGTQFNCNH
jgi:hypothetical protein